jgi:hypothetical protein
LYSSAVCEYLICFALLWFWPFIYSLTCEWIAELEEAEMSVIFDIHGDGIGSDNHQGVVALPVHCIVAL